MDQTIARVQDLTFASQTHRAEMDELLPRLAAAPRDQALAYLKPEHNHQAGVSV